ncbi:MAG: hypothetical protein ACRDL7_05710, partial [Gaiellaceae bacterium]
VRVQGHGRRQRALVATQHTFRKAMRVRVQDVEAYDKRPEQEAKAREYRARGGKATAQQRRTEADSHRQQATAIRSANPDQSLRLIAEAIAADCKRAGRPCKARTIQRHLSTLTQ